MEVLSKFPQRLKDLMSEHEISPEALAQEVGVYGSSVRDWMNGTSLISLSHAEKLADFFCCSLDYLAGLTDVYEDVPPKALPPFYDRLRKVMKQQGVTRYRVGKETGLKDIYFSKWAKGAMPELVTILPLAKILGVSLDYLVGRRDY